MTYIFVDISSHGFGHLAQVAPVLNELARLLPEIRLTVRSGLPIEKLRRRIHGAFEHIAERSDFGFVMLDAVSVDTEATARAYRDQHALWPQHVTDEAAFLTRLKPDLVLTDVAYLPLAGAAQANIPSLSMCSLNWADLFDHFFGKQSWASPIHRQMLDAYNSAECFLRLTPAMPMTGLRQTRAIAPVAALGINRRTELNDRLSCPESERLVLVAFGGIDMSLQVEHWPVTPGVRWLIPQSWLVRRDDMSPFEPLGMNFTDLLCSVDAVLTKPGYGTFTEAACNGTPVLYLRREDWPEQDCLIEWLHRHSCCAELSEAELVTGQFNECLDALLGRPRPPTPEPEGAHQAAVFLRHRLGSETPSA